MPNSKTMFLALLLGLPVVGLSQPDVQILNTFDMLGSEQLLDIYALPDEGYVMCGSSTEGEFGRPALGDPVVLKVDRNGNTVWSTRVSLVEHQAYASTVIQTDNGDYLCGGMDHRYFIAFRLDPSGELIWLKRYWIGKCWGVIELKAGEFILAGDHDGGCFIRIDGDGNVVWDRVIIPGIIGHFVALRETNGGVVAAGYGMADDHSKAIPWCVKVRTDTGEPIWWRSYPAQQASFVTYGMTSSGDGGFMLTGAAYTGRGTSGDDVFAMLISSEGEEIWTQIYEREYFQYGRAITRLSDGGYAIVGESSRFGPSNILPLVMRIDAQGEVRWEANYVIYDGRRFAKGSNMFWGVTTGINDEVVAVGAIKSFPFENYDGLIMKLAPDLPNQAYLLYTPEDTVFSMLPDTAVTFTVKPRAIDWREFNYTWTYRDSVWSNDTVCTVPLDQVGEQIVKTEVSQDEVSIPIRWHINVVDLFIYSQTPDTFNVTLRRGDSCAFSIDSIAAVNRDGINYYWVLTNLDDMSRQEMTDTNAVTVQFPDPGHYRMECVTSRGESQDNVVWSLLVRSSILNFSPGSLTIETYFDSTLFFSANPFNPGSDSLSYLWRLDGDTAGFDTSIQFQFDWDGAYEADHHQVQLLLADGSLVDSVLWNVTVNPPNSTGEDKSGFVRQFGLLPPSPNPFNSRALIRFNLPVAEAYQLTLHDVAGREVRGWRNQAIRAGRQSLVLDGEELAAGVYLVKLQAGGENSTAKVVLVK